MPSLTDAFYQFSVAAFDPRFLSLRHSSEQSSMDTTVVLWISRDTTGLYGMMQRSIRKRPAITIVVVGPFFSSIPLTEGNMIEEASVHDLAQKKILSVLRVQQKIRSHVRVRKQTIQRI